MRIKINIYLAFFIVFMSYFLGYLASAQTDSVFKKTESKSITVPDGWNYVGRILNGSDDSFISKVSDDAITYLQTDGDLKIYSVKDIKLISQKKINFFSGYIEKISAKFEQYTFKKCKSISVDGKYCLTIEWVCSEQNSSIPHDTSYLHLELFDLTNGNRIGIAEKELPEDVVFWSSRSKYDSYLDIEEPSAQIFLFDNQATITYIGKMMVVHFDTGKFEFFDIDATGCEKFVKTSKEQYMVLIRNANSSGDYVNGYRFFNTANNQITKPVLFGNLDEFMHEVSLNEKGDFGVGISFENIYTLDLKNYKCLGSYFYKGKIPIIPDRISISPDGSLFGINTYGADGFVVCSSNWNVIGKFPDYPNLDKPSFFFDNSNLVLPFTKDGEFVGWDIFRCNSLL